jgi:putative redox protein
MANYFDEDIKASIGLQKYLCTINWRNGSILMDEPIAIGGGDLGPDPHSVLLASLAACTLSTLRMYIDRKGWDIPEINISLNLTVNKEPLFSTEIKRDIHFSKVVSNEQKERLLLIAGKCPISKILENKITIKSTI